MGIVKFVADFFRSAPTAPIDRYGILSPLMATSECVASTQKYLKALIDARQVGPILTQQGGSRDIRISRAMEAYKTYVTALPAHEKAMEKQAPLSTALVALEYIAGNLEIIEDNFNALFGELTGEANDAAIRSSSLVTIGYIETANIFVTWLGQLTAHITPDEVEIVPPFWTKEMLLNARTSADFVANNLNKWNPHYKGLMQEIKDMQRKGTDVSIKSGDNWMDEFVHDNQFSGTEQNLMSASLRSPILWYATQKITAAQEKIERLTTEKEWFIARIALLEAKIGGMDANAPEYRRLKKASDYYAGLITKHEQKIERMRA